MPNVSYPNQVARNAALRQAFLKELRSLISKYSDVVKVKDDAQYNYYHHVELEILID